MSNWTEREPGVWTRSPIDETAARKYAAERATSIDGPFYSERLCRCGHQEKHHVAARLACPVVTFQDDGDFSRCACPKFQAVEEEPA